MRKGNRHVRENALILPAVVLLCGVYSAGLYRGADILPPGQWTGLFLMVLAAVGMAAFLVRWVRGARSGPVTVARLAWAALAMFLGYSIYSGDPALNSPRVSGPVTVLMIVSLIVESRLRIRADTE
jgi:drug/metabolite transporter (DMT)-like permease